MLLYAVQAFKKYSNYFLVRFLCGGEAGLVDAVVDVVIDLVVRLIDILLQGLRQ
jgi:hypothetical protein